jgi:hypothetical protein
MTEDEAQELANRIGAEWDKLPMPPPEWMELFEEASHSYQAWKRLDFPMDDDDEDSFNAHTPKQRMFILVSVFRLMNRQPNPN